MVRAEARVRARTRLAILLSVAGFAVACDSPVAPRAPAVVSLVAQPAGPLVHQLDITLSRSGPIAVEYWTSDGPRLRVSADSAAASHRLLLPRLRPGRSYGYEVTGTSFRGALRTDTLPSDLAQVRFTATGAATVPLVLVHLSEPTGFRGYAIVDSDGEVVWYFRTADIGYGAARRANGNFVFMVRGLGLIEVTPAGQVVNTLPQDMQLREQHHDVIATPDNTLLFIAFDQRMHEGAPLKGEAIWEWSPENGTAVRRWTSWDFLSPAHDRGPRFDSEWLHANALARGPRGNVLMSLHYLDQVVSIAPDWRAIEWRLGGVNATIGLPAPEQFSGQHTAHEFAPGRVILFDNRHAQNGATSRAVEFELVGNRAEKRWEWTPPQRNHATIVSSARRLANGHTLVGFGVRAGVAGASGPTEVYEVSAAGAVIWRLSLNTQVMFRAEPLMYVAGEVVTK